MMGRKQLGNKLTMGPCFSLGSLFLFCCRIESEDLCFFISLHHLTTKQTCSFSLYFKGASTVISQAVAAVIAKWIVNLLIHVDPRFSAGHAAFVGKWFCLEPKG